MEERKKLRELNLSDNFLFGKVMEDKEILKAVLEEILQFKISRVELATMQKTIEIDDISKGIRLDVYAADDEKNIYSVEMQNQNEYNIAKRSRYYKSTMDLDLLTKGMKYTQLTKSFVIFICTFDAFKKGRIKYTFEEICVEEPKLKLEDGTQIIILNTTGTENAEACELREFLKYVSTSTEDVVKKSESTLVKRLHEKMERVKNNPETEVEYLTILERDEQNYERGKSEGHEEGLTEGISLGIERGRTEGIDLGLERGRTEGIDIGLERGIQALIVDNLEEEIPKERIIEKLKVRFDLTQETAEAYFCKLGK